jgi:hypothetical protein
LPSSPGTRPAEKRARSSFEQRTLPRSTTGHPLATRLLALPDDAVHPGSPISRQWLPEGTPPLLDPGPPPAAALVDPRQLRPRPPVARVGAASRFPPRPADVHRPTTVHERREGTSDQGTGRHAE